MLTLITDFGIVDLTFNPADPTHGFTDWNADATSEEIAAGIVIRVAALDDIIESKRAANRVKDQRALPYLESLREVRQSDSQSGRRRFEPEPPHTENPLQFRGFSFFQGLEKWPENAGAH